MPVVLTIKEVQVCVGDVDHKSTGVQEQPQHIMRFWLVCLFFLKERGNRRGRERGSKRGRETVEREDPGLSLREPRGC